MLRLEKLIQYQSSFWRVVINQPSIQPYQEFEQVSIMKLNFEVTDNGQLLQDELKRSNAEIATELLLQFYEKGEEIPLFEPGFWQVVRGVVQLSEISPDGDEIILGWVTANNSFGDFVPERTNYRAQALSNAYLMWWSLGEVAKSPELARIFMSQLSQRLIKAQQLLSITGIRKMRERLWQLLLMLKEEMGQSVSDGTRLTIRFSHQNLAQIICTTRVTVTRILGDFQEQGLISIDSTRHIIIRENQLNIKPALTDAF